MLKPIIEEQYTAAQAYFLCVIALLFIETLVQLPSYIFMRRTRGMVSCYQNFQCTNQICFIGSLSTKPSVKHSQLYTFVHKLTILPSLIPFITHHTLPDLLRLGTFVGLNILFGWNDNEYSTQYKLYGWLTIANGGLALLMASRTNLFSIVALIPSNVLLMYHRWIGRATVIHATIHFALNTRHDIVTQQFADAYASRRIQVGVMGWLALAIMFITSFSFIRRRYFEAFYYTHALFIVFTIAALIHATKGPEFMLPGLGLWAIDRIVRFVNNFRHIEVLSVTHLVGDVVKLRFSGMKTIRPGQITWIQIPGVSFLNWHPFTIASSPGEVDGTLAIRALGGYTKKLQKISENEGTPKAKGEGQVGIPTPSKLKIRLDGPYGTGKIQWGLHPVTVLVAGGIGITPGISIAKHIVSISSSAHAQGNTLDRWHIHLLWVVKDIRHAEWFIEELKSLATIAAAPNSTVTIDVEIHVTGEKPAETVLEITDTSSRETMGEESVRTGISVSKEESGIGMPYTYSGPGDVLYGRPDFGKYFTALKTKRPGLDAAINICGPRPMINSARRAAASACNGGILFYVEEEVFEF